jgi:cytochrome c553
MILPLFRSSQVMRSLLIFAICCFCFDLALGADAATPEQEKFFEEKVRPLLANACYECHSEKKQESELRLDTATTFARGGASGEKLVDSAHPEQSYFLKLVRHEGDIKMPPKSKLSSEQIATLEQWIRLGAPWPKATSQEPQVLSAAEKVAQQRRDHWAYQPIQAPAVPTVKQTAWPRNDVDRFILAKLEAKGLQPSSEADKQTLMRRLYFDLVGLPPTPSEIDEFMNDNTPEAYAKLVDRLLASPHYGERWGRHWLDVARYADTRGYNFEGDRRFPYAYTYRDYVVSAFNRDLPVNRFLLEQVAADQLDLGEDRSALAALGFITVGRKFLNHHDILDDQIDVVARGMLGLTVACARCHDHKYDAIPTDDYYSLYGVFASSTEPDNSKLPIIGKPNEVAGFEAFQKKLDELEAAHRDFLEQKRVEIEEHGRTQVVQYWAYVAVDSKPELLAKLSFVTIKTDDLRKNLVDRWRNFLRDRAKPEHPILGLWAELNKLPPEKYAAEAPGIVKAWQQRTPGMSPGQINPELLASLKDFQPSQIGDVAKLYGDLLLKSWEAWKILGGKDETLDKLTDELRPFAQLIVGKDAPTSLNQESVPHLFRRDEANKHRDLRKKIDQHQANSQHAPPRAMVLEERENPYLPHVFIRGNHGRPGKRVPRQMLAVVAGEERKPFPHRGGRLDLAEAIAAPENPLTRRVFVNRVWMHHFGEPLVDTPSDFGIRTPLPEQSLLLDHLASYLLQQNWSLKQLHRYLVLSATYRQQSHVRAECQNIDPENRLYWKMNIRRLEWETLRDAVLTASGELDRTLGGKAVELTKQPYPKRRTIYGHVDRQDLPNLFRVFDLASPDTSVARRARTTVPQQSLFLMNSPFTLQQAQALAKRSDDPNLTEARARLERLYRYTLSRAPRPEELELAEKFIATVQESGDDKQVNAWEQLAQTLLMSNEFAHID